MFYNHNCYRLILYLNDLSANYLLLYPVYPIRLLFTLTVPQLAAFIKHFPTNERLRTLFLSLFSCCFYMWMTPCLVSYFMKQSALWTLLHCPLTLFLYCYYFFFFLFTLNFICHSFTPLPSFCSAPLPPLEELFIDLRLFSSTIEHLVL